MDDEYKNFLAELGGTVPDSLTMDSGSNGGGVSSHPGLGSGGLGFIKSKDNDDTNLYIGYLPPTLEDEGLISHFSAFGEIVMAKVIKERGTNVSKGYGFVKYASVEQANAAIAGMNGRSLDGRTIAVRVAGRPPEPAPPQPRANPPLGQNAYPSQHFITGGPLGGGPPPPSYSAPVPWGPPPPYPGYPPPPPGSNYYPPPPPVQTHHVSPYGVQYPPPPAPIPSGTTSQTVPPAQPSYMPSSYGYSPYYGAPPPPPPPPAELPQGLSNVPWASNPPPPPAPPEPAAPQGADAEYEKFMAEMK